MCWPFPPPPPLSSMVPFGTFLLLLLLLLLPISPFFLAHKRIFFSKRERKKIRNPFKLCPSSSQKNRFYSFLFLRLTRSFEKIMGDGSAATAAAVAAALCVVTTIYRMPWEKNPTVTVNVCCKFKHDCHVFLSGTSCSSKYWGVRYAITIFLPLSNGQNWRQQQQQHRDEQ